MDSADTDVQHVHQWSGFLNRVRWFDSGRGHLWNPFSGSGPATIQARAETLSRVGPAANRDAVGNWLGVQTEAARLLPPLPSFSRPFASYVALALLSLS